MNPPEIHSIEYVTIAVYLLLMMGVGWVFKNFNKGISDYFKGGSRGAWWLVGMSMFMGTFSAWTFTGAAGVAYQAGWSASIIFLSTAAGYFVNFACTGPWFRQIRVTTGPEVLKKRYGHGTQQFYAWISMVTGTLYAGLHLYGLSIFCSAVFGLPVQGVIIVIGVAVLFYATTGGSWAVMATDFLQSIILLPITLLVAYLAYRAIGGFEGFQTAVQTQGLGESFKMINHPGEFAAGAFTWGWASAMFTKNIVGWNTLGSANRFFALKDGRAARKASLLCAVLMIAGCVIWFLPPMVGRLLYSSQVDAMTLGKNAEAA
ncbi:MAG: sodium:solute symporter family protein, partial [Puniceicoccales bacterium]